MSYLIYHPTRKLSRFGALSVYHDTTTGNQDPYLWNESFLHTYCHITQLKDPKKGDINFWVSGNGKFPRFDELLCDLVFVVEANVPWAHANSISRHDIMVDSDEAYADHYQWAKYQHRFKRRKRFTLKADTRRSFQPQHGNGTLIDIIEPLAKLGLSRKVLREGMRAGRGSRPFKLDKNVAHGLYAWLQENADAKLRGIRLAEIRRKNSELGSPPPRTKRSSGPC